MESLLDELHRLLNVHDICAGNDGFCDLYDDLAIVVRNAELTVRDNSARAHMHDMDCPREWQ